ncbi:hypothetical protein Tco_0027314 [Tanacetum coccineum]
MLVRVLVFIGGEVTAKMEAVIKTSNKGKLRSQNSRSEARKRIGAYTLYFSRREFIPTTRTPRVIMAMDDERNKNINMIPTGGFSHSPRSIHRRNLSPNTRSKLREFKVPLVGFYGEAKRNHPCSSTGSKEITPLEEDAQGECLPKENEPSKPPD